jgi:hypothetical protein
VTVLESQLAISLQTANNRVPSNPPSALACTRSTSESCIIPDPDPILITPVDQTGPKRSEASTVPPDRIVHDLIDSYFSRIHPWAPFISSRRPDYHPPWTPTVLAIIAVTVLFSRDPLTRRDRDRYRKAAKEHVLLHAAQHTSISSLEALAVLALDLIGSDQGPNSWGILDLLFRGAVRLGLIREDEHTGTTKSLGSKAPAPYLEEAQLSHPAVLWEQDEANRRLFWMIFCIDRYISVSTGWDFALSTYDIKRRLPCSDALWSRQVRPCMSLD